MDSYIAVIDTFILLFLIGTWLIERCEGNCCDHCPDNNDEVRLD